MGLLEQASLGVDKIVAGRDPAEVDIRPVEVDNLPVEVGSHLVVVRMGLEEDIVPAADTHNLAEAGPNPAVLVVLVGLVAHSEKTH